MNTNGIINKISYFKTYHTEKILYGVNIIFFKQFSQTLSGLTEETTLQCPYICKFPLKSSDNFISNVVSSPVF